MFSHLSVVALATVVLAADATIVPLAGPAINGKLIDLTGERVVVSDRGTERALAAADLMSVEFAKPDKPLEKTAVWIDLLDGSRLLAESYVALEGKSTLQLVGGPVVQIPTRAIASVRFRQQDADLAAQWGRIVGGTPAGDLLVIRKSSQRTIEDGDNEPKVITETALDELDGTILQVTPDSVQFEFDGERLEVKREKIEGLVYYYPVKREFPAAVCRLTDAGGSQWNLKSIELKADRLAILSAAGAALEFPIAAIAKVDFSVGNIAFLTELEPDTGDGEAAVSLQPAAMVAGFGRVFQASKHPPPGSDRFRVGGVTYGHAFSLHSPLTLVFRVPEGFRKLHALAGVDDAYLIPGRFTLLILGDGKEMLRHDFGPDEGRGPVAINLDVAAVKRIAIVLDPADGQDIGDQLNLCEARFSK